MHTLWRLNSLYTLTIPEIGFSTVTLFPCRAAGLAILSGALGPTFVIDGLAAHAAQPTLLRLS